MKGSEILQTLIELLEAQEKIKVTYKIKENKKDERQVAKNYP